MNSPYTCTKVSIEYLFKLNNDVIKIILLS